MVPALLAEPRTECQLIEPNQAIKEIGNAVIRSIVYAHLCSASGHLPVREFCHQAGQDFRHPGSLASRADHDDHVNSRQVARLSPKDLSDHPLDRIAVVRHAYEPLRDDDPESWPTALVSDCEYPDRTPVLSPFGASKDPIVINRIEKTPASRKVLGSSLQIATRLRPFARRALRTFRPPRVAIRARNPWLRCRFKLLGW